MARGGEWEMGESWENLASSLNIDRLNPLNPLNPLQNPLPNFFRRQQASESRSPSLTYRNSRVSPEVL